MCCVVALLLSGLLRGSPFEDFTPGCPRPKMKNRGGGVAIREGPIQLRKIAKNCGNCGRLRENSGAVTKPPEASRSNTSAQRLGVFRCLFKQKIANNREQLRNCRKLRKIAKLREIANRNPPPPREKWEFNSTALPQHMLSCTWRPRTTTPHAQGHDTLAVTAPARVD